MNYNVQSSDLQTADAIVFAKPCKLHAVTLIANGTDAGTIVLHDNASAASGTTVAKIALPASAVATNTITFPEPIVCRNGIYGNVTTANYIVYYSVGD